MNFPVNKILIMALMSFDVQAAETDTFTKRFEPLVDSSEIINTRANTYIRKSLSDLNNTNFGCREDQLYLELRKYFANHISGQLTQEIIKDVNIPKRLIVLGGSVYRTWRPWDGLGMGLTVVKRTGLTLSSVLKIGDEYIGIDKFEHFFGQGFYYFKENYIQKNGPVTAVKIGILKEKTILGGNKIGNGVFSYGDLAANFNGMRFWNHILQQNDDVLGTDENLGPYVVCENQKWVQVKSIDFRDYIDSSMDEAINCSKYPTRVTTNRFIKEVELLGLNCPVEKQKLEQLNIKYRTMSKWIINSDGPGVVKYLGEFRNKK